MRIVSWDEAMAGGQACLPGPVAATIGVFDGVHLGHRELIRHVLDKAPALAPVAVTFRENPKRVTAPSRFMGDIFTLEQKLETLDALGIHTCVLIDFSSNFSKLAGNEFISALTGSCGVRYFAVGADFKCGHRLSTDALALSQLALAQGALVDVVPPVMSGGHKVSSSGIRMAIQKGRMDLAFAMLGSPYTLDLMKLETERLGTVMTVHAQGRGFVLPRNGRYEGTARGARSSLPCALEVKDGLVTAQVPELTEQPRFLEFDPYSAYNEQGE